MRTFMDVLRLELRLQCGAPLFVGLLLLFFTIHLLTITQVGINLTDNQLINYNSAYLIFRTELVLSVFGMLPAIIFVVNAATRDHSLLTAEQFYTTPVAKLAFVLGRFSGGAVCAVLVGLAGLLGTLCGSFMPWLEAERVTAFTWQPYATAFAAIVVPNALVFCAFSFSVAAITRKAASSFAMALAFVAFALFINTRFAADAPEWLPMWDPFGALPVELASRYWSVVELNTFMPLALLPANRLLWLALALSALVVTCWRFRLEHVPPGSMRLDRRPAGATRARPETATGRLHGSFGRRDTLAQFGSQWRMDMRAVLKSPLFWLVTVLTIVSMLNELQNRVAPLAGLPLHPVTGQLLGLLRFGLLQFVFIVIIFYSAVLMHREREHRLHEILGATPYPDWLPMTSKVLALCAVLMLLLLASVLTCIGWQIAAGHSDFEPGVYLQGVLVDDGFYFCMLAVLACVLQAIAPGKWSGMALVTSALIVLLSLEPAGFEHLLYGFRIPNVIYSDMNGWGHFLVPTYSLIVYWGAFSILLIVAGHLLLPRGAYVGVIARLRQAGSRITPAVRTTTAIAATVFVLAGLWIFYNTNVLNEYRTAQARLEQQAAYERNYSAYKQLLTPVVTAIELAIDLYPQERRLQSSGRASLRNETNEALTKIILSADPRLSLTTLTIDGGTLSQEDRKQGFFVFSLARPLQPGAQTTLAWAAERGNRGFVNSAPETDIVENGTFVNLPSVMPWPFYDYRRELTEDSERKRAGLPPAPRLPALGDPAWLDKLDYGTVSAADFRVVFSTDADQTAVAPGVLRREWQQAGRRYFEYQFETPTRPVISLSSARYEVARDQWNGVAVEVYHDAKHPWNVRTMLDTSKTALEYFSREFRPYPRPYFRIVEFPGYTPRAQAYAGTIPYSETAGFLTNLNAWLPLDYGTIHELAHQWWGGFAQGARMQGRQILNEGLAEYSTWMLLKQQKNPFWVRQTLAATHDRYLKSRSAETQAELPVLLTEDQEQISYGKAPLAMFALQELIGADKMHQALRSYLDKFALQPPPYPTSRDLVNEFRAVAGPEHQQLITDLFEKITLYDVQMTTAAVTQVAGEYEVTMDITARQFEADRVGHETEVPLDTWFQVVIFPDSEQTLLAQTPLYQQHHRLRSGSQRVTVRVPQKPGAAGVDPFHLMIDRTPRDNVRSLDKGDRTQE